MIITSGNIMLVMAVLLFMSVLASKAGFRYGLPSLLLFLVVGMLAGVDGFGVQFDSAEVAQFIGMISLSIILFSGGLDTDFKQIRPVLGPGIILATIGVLLTTGICGAFIYYLFQIVAIPGIEFGWTESLLLAAIMSSTDSASVFSILNSSKKGLKENMKPLLELESGSNDPMAYLLVIVLIQIMEGSGMSGSALWADSILLLVKQLVVGAISGVAIGFGAVWVINKIKASNEFMYPILLLSVVAMIFSVTELIGGNSYLAVYIGGLVVGNRKIVLKHTITTFFGGFTWLVQIVMFLSLGLLVNPHELVDWHVIVVGLALGLFMILLGRPIAVMLSIGWMRQFSMKAKAFVCWVGLRGAVPIIFATYALMSENVPHAKFMFNIVFFITILSLILQGTSINRIAQKFKLDVPLKDAEFNVTLPDEITAVTSEIEVSAELISDGALIRDITLPPKTLVVMVKRGERYLVPTGNTRLCLGDSLFIISEDHKDMEDLMARHG